MKEVKLSVFIPCIYHCFRFSEGFRAELAVDRLHGYDRMFEHTNASSSFLTVTLFGLPMVGRAHARRLEKAGNIQAMHNEHEAWLMTSGNCMLCVMNFCTDIE